MDNNVIRFQADTVYGNSGSDENTAEWVSIKQSGSEWVISNSSTNWRAIKQTVGNTSNAFSLFKIDENKPITVAKGTQIIYVEYMGPNNSNNDTLTCGLVANASVSYSNYISSGSHSYGTNNSYYYGATKIGGGDPKTESNYGGIDAYAVFGSTSENNPELYMATYANGGDNFGGRYYQSAYTIAASTSNYGWVDDSKHGYIFAAITGEYNVTVGRGAWSKYEISCDKNYKYEIEIDVHCADTGYEGILVFTGEHSTKPDENKKISDFNDTDRVTKIDGSGSVSFTVDGEGTSKKFYVYFKTSPYNRDGTMSQYGYNTFRYASIKVTRFINVKVSGNDGTIGGEYNIPLQMAPYKPYTGVLDSRLVNPVVSRDSITGVNWSSVSGFYESNIVSSPNYSKLVITSLGKFAGGSTEAEYNKLLATDASNINLYLHWKDAYDTGTFVSGPVSTYCTSAPMISNTTSNEISLTITDSDHKGVKFASGLVDDYYCNLPSGFKIDSDNNGTYLTVPSGLPAGTYNLNPVTFSSPGSTYEGVSVSKDLPVINVSSVEISSIEPSAVITQSSIIPARSITLDRSNLSNYFSVIALQTITYNNDTSSVEVVDSNRWRWGGSVYIPSKGKITERTSSGFTFNGNECYVELLESRSYISTTASREINVVESVFIYDSNYNNTSILHVNELINFNISAQYTSGEIRDLTNDGDDGPETSVFYSVIYPSLYFSML